ncbi:MAG: NifB/NifX family molybdenum-iron cluster-binding protein [Desulforhabdus sp.]|jgi:predicted Fe-Mo cluster-binding NifX family protein|nr:NifB/NifX family molybdenum-iron cluster-binding protein [Desulforhabdus sp.]
MKVCFPTENLQGLDSTVYGHFGSAPGFIIVDTETNDVDQIANGDQHHAHGMCQPLLALGGRRVDGVAVGGIGMGALMKLQAQGIRVYRAMQGTVRDNLKMIQIGRLPEMSPQHTCAGHGHGGGCGH